MNPSSRKRPTNLFLISVAILVGLFLLSLAQPSAPRCTPLPCVSGPVNAKSTPTESSSATKSYKVDKRSSASGGRPERCPEHYAPNHGLENTGRKALVLYTFTSHTDVFDRQVEVDNFLFFRSHGILPPDTATALFSSVDYIVATSDLDRAPTATNGDVSDHGVVHCAASENVKVMETPGGPCDLCAQARVIRALGGAEAVSRKYEYVFFANSGVRGPFFTEATEGSAPPVTWLDHFALGGEKVYTGAIMSSTSGGAAHRPFLTSFAFGLPSSALPAAHPVLAAACSEANPPKFWPEFLKSYDADLHTTESEKNLLVTLKKVRDHPQLVKSSPTGRRDTAAEKAVDEEVAAGAREHHDRAGKMYADLTSGDPSPPWIGDNKMKCVYHTEAQLLKTVVTTQLPPEKDDAHGAASWPYRPRLTAIQRSQLSPLLSGYLHEAHYFGRSLQNNLTMLNMGHGAVALRKPSPGGTLCDAVLLKYGGVAWRAKQISVPFAEAMQTLTLSQWPKRPPPAGLDIADVLRCPTRSRVEPLRPV